MISTLHNLNWPSVLTRGFLFAVFWWVLTDGEPGSWVVGAPAVLLACAVSVATLAPANMRALQALRLAPFFIKRSLLGALDVAIRALRPSLPLTPVLVEYRLSIPAGLSRMVLLNIISLLPGTLCADIRGDVLSVHALDGTGDFRAELAEVERAVARLYPSG